MRLRTVYEVREFSFYNERAMIKTKINSAACAHAMITRQSLSSTASRHRNLGILLGTCRPLSSSPVESQTPSQQQQQQQPHPQQPPLSVLHARLAPHLAELSSSLPITQDGVKRLLKFPQPTLAQPIPGAATNPPPEFPSFPTGFRPIPTPTQTPTAAAGILLTGSFTGAAESTTKATWTSKSVRTGVLAIKRGMTSLWDEWGVLTPCTVLEVKQNQVVHTRW